MANNITLIMDTREQDGLSFKDCRGVSVVRKGLKTGDYSIENYESRICWERKSVQDAVGTLIGGHERFLREIDRMKSFDEKYILIEHSPSVMYNYCARHGWTQKYDIVIQSLLAYACVCNVRVRFCKDREDMEKYIVRKAREFLAKQQKGEEQCLERKEP